MKPSFKMLDRSIIKDLSSGDEMTAQDLRYRHGVTNQKIRGSLTRLCDQGLVERAYYDG
jgi:predicted ArsR family transcriptional regulator